MSTQNYQNHAQRVPGFLAVGLALLLSFVGSLVNLYNSIGDHQRIYSASLLVVLTVCVFFVAFFCRTFALKAQDRGIRAEENLRHFAMTGKLLDPRLTIQQIIALRFASDGEFLQLAAEAAEKGTDAKTIKQSIKSWRADTHRA